MALPRSNRPPGTVGALRLGPPAVVVALGLVACDSGSVSSPTYSVRDSAGVEIVESTAPLWRDGEAWTVSEEPILRIGVVEGAPEYQFSIVSGVFEEDGRIVVGDASGEVRIFDRTGTFLRAFGRLGDGPGEFGRLVWVQPFLGDSLLTWDPRGRRLSVFDHDGTFVRAVSLPPIAWTPGGASGALDDGTFLGSSTAVFRGRTGERVVGETHLTVFSAEGDSARSLGPFQVEMEFPDFSAAVRLSTPYPRIFLFTQRPGGVLVLDSPRLEIQDISFDGGLERILRATHLDLVLTDEHRASYRASERERLAEDTDPGALETALVDVRFPQTVPASSQLLLDSEGHLWVRHYSTRWTVGPEHWSVFDPEGVLLGVVETPERLQVRQIEQDFLLGIWTDDLDVRYIREYALVR